jgi:asparagine synthase (glutamine-hydrolysing)
MCGIIGLIGNMPARQGEEILLNGLQLMLHRGPDGAGVWCSPDGRVFLGHRRLAIIDLSDRATQPMSDVGGRFVISFNGEIYNYVEIREELKGLGAVFHSDSDTEVILEAYKQWGEACLERFNGMFAFAVYDSIQNKLFCARDRYGEKPFLFIAGKDFFAFASEYKALFQIREAPIEYDEFRLLRGLHNASTGLDADNDTVFPAIKQLRPSEKLILNTNTLEYRISRYWDAQVNPDMARLSEQEAFELFRDLLTDSVRIRMRSDVPVGSCLSGGLDSSAIVCIAKRLLGEGARYHTFTGRFPGTPADEWEYAREVVDEAGGVSHIVEPTAERFAEELPEFMWYNELPVGSSSQYAQWCVFRLAKEHGVTVLLDGQGSDEMLGGYEQYFQRYVQCLKETGQIDRLERELPGIWERYPLALVPRLRSFRDRLPFSFRHFIAGNTCSGSSLLYGIHFDVARRLRKADSHNYNEKRFNTLADALYQDSFGRYLTTLLRYGDRNSMAHSREVRLPFCDHRLAEMAFSLPPWHLMGEVQTKRLLRESMCGILPEKIRTRWNKQGFRPPQDLWFKGPLFKTAQEIIEDREFENSSVWSARWWRSVLKRIQNGEANLGWTLWQPLMMEYWRRYFLGRLDQCQRISISGV